jgi:hypothetical protein
MKKKEKKIGVKKMKDELQKFMEEYGIDEINFDDKHVLKRKKNGKK